jgi:hypothetical protein
MEEVFLLLVVVRDESEAFVANNAFDRSTRHPLLLTFLTFLLCARWRPIILPLSYTNTPAVAFIFRADKQWNVHRELH